MTDIINKNAIETPNPRSSNVILLDTTGTPLEASYPNGVYAQLTYSASDVSSSPSLSSGSILDNTAYQDTPFNAQVDVTTSAAQITANAKKGWVTLTIDPDTTDVVYVGAAGVSTTTGTILKASNPTMTVSSDDLSEWYVIGAAGGEKLYVIGAYIA